MEKVRVKRLALFGGLSEQASDSYERTAASMLQHIGRADLVHGQQVLPLMQMVLPDHDIGDIEKHLLSSDLIAAKNTAQALAFIYGMSCEEAVREGAAAIALACNTHANFFPSHVQGAEVIDIADATLRAIGSLAGNKKVVLMGTEITNRLGYWRGKIKAAGGSTITLAGDEGRAIVDMLFVEGRIQDAPGSAALHFSAKWRTFLDNAAGQAESAYIIEACTDIAPPISASGEVLPKSQARVFNTADAHIAAIAIWLRDNVPPLAPEVREALIAEKAATPKVFLCGHDKADRPWFGPARAGVKLYV